MNSRTPNSRNRQLTTRVISMAVLARMHCVARTSDYNLFGLSSEYSLRVYSRSSRSLLAFT